MNFAQWYQLAEVTPSRNEMDYWDYFDWLMFDEWIDADFPFNDLAAFDEAANLPPTFRGSTYYNPRLYRRLGVPESPWQSRRSSMYTNVEEHNPKASKGMDAKYIKADIIEYLVQTWATLMKSTRQVASKGSEEKKAKEGPSAEANRIAQLVVDQWDKNNADGLVLAKTTFALLLHEKVVGPLAGKKSAEARRKIKAFADAFTLHFQGNNDVSFPKGTNSSLLGEADEAINKILSHVAEGSSITIEERLKGMKEFGRNRYKVVFLYIAPSGDAGIKTCFSDSPSCRDCCLSFSGNPISLPGKVTARIDRVWHLAVDPADFFKKVTEEVEQYRDEAEKEGKTLVVRLNATSDLSYDSDQFGTAGGTQLDNPDIADDFQLAFKSFMETFPDVIFYDYTKIEARMLKFLRASEKDKWPDNYHLTFSFSEVPVNQATTRNVLKLGGNVAMVFGVDRRGALPAKWKDLESDAEYEVIDGDAHDLRFRDDEEYLGKNSFVSRFRQKKPAFEYGKKRKVGKIVGLKAKGDALWDYNLPKFETAVKEFFNKVYPAQRKGDRRFHTTIETSRWEPKLEDANAFLDWLITHHSTPGSEATYRDIRPGFVIQPDDPSWYQADIATAQSAFLRKLKRHLKITRRTPITQGPGYNRDMASIYKGDALKDRVAFAEKGSIEFLAFSYFEEWLRHAIEKEASGKATSSWRSEFYYAILAAYIHRFQFNEQGVPINQEPPDIAARRAEVDRLIGNVSDEATYPILRKLATEDAEAQIKDILATKANMRDRRVKLRKLVHPAGDIAHKYTPTPEYLDSREIDWEKTDKVKRLFAKLKKPSARTSLPVV